MKATILKLAFISVIAFLGIHCSDTNTDSNNIVVVAHRGVSSSFPENTAQAFQAAVDQHIEGVEFDIYLTKDDSVIIFHDLTVERLTDGSGFVHDFSAKELKDGIFRKSGGIGLTLNEFIANFKNSFQYIFIEIKEGQSSEKINNVVSQLEKLVRENNLEGKVIATCTAEQPLDSLTALNKAFQVAIEVRDETELALQLKKYKRVLISFDKLSPSIYQTTASAKAQLITFTPNTIAEYDKVLNAGADFIMTDNPSALKKYLQIK